MVPRSWQPGGPITLASDNLHPGTFYDIAFGTERVEYHRMPMSALANAVDVVPGSELRDIELGGPGVLKSGGRLIGGGLGLAGAAGGIALASVLNSLSATTSIQSILTVRSASSEAFFHNQHATPEQWRRHLSPAFVRLQQLGDIAKAGAQTGSSDLDQLERLAALRQTGALSESEFEAAKHKILGI
jgi:hypothetical protein